MASLSVEKVGSVRTGSLLLACVADNGSTAHPYFKSEALLRGPDSARNLADAVHFLCSLHAQLPGLLELAAIRSKLPEARAWLDESDDAFGGERLYLTQLAATVGPLPGTPGGGASHAAVLNQRNAVTTLAQSERNGCALGAAAAFVADWSAIRIILDFTAQRFGLEVPEFRLSGAAALRALIDSVAAAAPVERALMFGAEQIAIQHRGLWDLLETRAEARRDC